jgi:hypothetical protein
VTEFPWITATVLMDDGTEYKVQADQRDQRLAMMPTNYGGAGIRDAETDPLGWMRAVAWAFLTRKQMIDVSWPAFNDTCAFVKPDNDDAAGDELEAPGPTRPALAG